MCFFRPSAEEGGRGRAARPSGAPVCLECFRTTQRRWCGEHGLGGGVWGGGGKGFTRVLAHPRASRLFPLLSIFRRSPGGVGACAEGECCLERRAHSNCATSGSAPQLAVPSAGRPSRQHSLLGLRRGGDRGLLVDITREVSGGGTGFLFCEPFTARWCDGAGFL